MPQLVNVGWTRQMGAGGKVKPTTAVFNSSSTSFNVSRRVLNGDATGFNVDDEVLNSSGAGFEIFN